MPESINGLPLHPLVVHAVVVLLPLSAVGLVLLIFIPRWRPRFQWLVLGGLVVGGIGTYLAKVSGDSLSAAVGLPSEHAEWGNLLVPVAMGLTAIAGLWIFLTHLDGWTWAKRSVEVVTVPVALAAIVLTYLTGNSGARSVWEEQLVAARQPPATAASITGPISLEEIGRHSTPEDCWSAVDGSVYDLTEFIARHPAGAGAVIGMCGRDATDDFLGEHAGQAEAEGWLEVFKIGTLAR